MCFLVLCSRLLFESAICLIVSDWPPGPVRGGNVAWLSSALPSGGALLTSLSFALMRAMVPLLAYTLSSSPLAHPLPAGLECHRPVLGSVTYTVSSVISVLCPRQGPCRRCPDTCCHVWRTACCFSQASPLRHSRGAHPVFVRLVCGAYHRLATFFVPPPAAAFPRLSPLFSQPSLALPPPPARVPLCSVFCSMSCPVLCFVQCSVSCYCVEWYRCV